MRKSQRNSEAIVLKKINLGDSDRIYTILTRNFGKISAIAKGVRKITSRRSGSLDSINYIKVFYSEGISGYKTLHEVEVINSFKNVKKSLERSQIAYYFAELINKSIEEDSEKSEVFGLLKEYLEKLDGESPDLVFLVNKFEYLLMKMLGYEISLEKLKSFGKDDLERRLKNYVRDVLGEDFKSLKL